VRARSIRREPSARARARLGTVTRPGVLLCSDGPQQEGPRCPSTRFCGWIQAQAFSAPPEPLRQVAGVRIWHRGPKLLAAKLLFANGTTAPIKPEAHYNVATLDYLANGGDGFKDLEAAPSLMALGRQIDELMFADLKASMPKAVGVRGPVLP
jgi:hypothetical protein